jgi:ketosteroid isomerase-like protein
LKNPEWRTLYYKPEYKELRIAGNWAFECGYFDTAHRESAHAKPVALRGTVLRVLKREPDGSWKLARAALIESPLDSH